MEMSPQNRQSLISNGVHFIRAMTEYYGPDKGMEMWDRIVEVCEPELKGEIFFAMICGDVMYNSLTLRGVTATQASQLSNIKIDLIKTLRWYSNAGLKEAKDAIDAVLSGKDYSFQCDSTLIPAARQKFRTLGIDT